MLTDQGNTTEYVFIGTCYSFIADSSTREKYTAACLTERSLKGFRNWSPVLFPKCLFRLLDNKELRQSTLPI